MNIPECQVLGLVDMAYSSWQGSHRVVEFYTSRGSCDGKEVYRAHYGTFGEELYYDIKTQKMTSGTSSCHSNDLYNAVSHLFR